MTKCDRCGQETLVTTMSWFNTDIICDGCDKKERAHPQFEQARQRESDAVLRGVRNFPGIGLPPDLRHG